jgi:hypothetical protein
MTCCVQQTRYNIFYAVHWVQSVLVTSALYPVDSFSALCSKTVWSID